MYLRNNNKEWRMFMNKQRFEDIVKNTEDKKDKLGRSIVAFVSGGIVAVLGQLFFDFYNIILDVNYKESLTLMLVTIIFITSLLTGLGIFDKIAQKCGAGTFVPISGFANALTSSALESKSEGLIYGIGSNMFKLAGSVITYGVVSAYILGILRYVIFVIGGVL
jgi:stage V sporulation protein AC